MSKLTQEEISKLMKDTEIRDFICEHEHKRLLPLGVIGCELPPEKRWAIIEYLKTDDPDYLTLFVSVK